MGATERLNILMVDDQPAKLLTYESMLAGLGERLIVAQTAREALAVLLKEEIAVVLMDVNMPELDGFELASMMRQHPRCQKTAIIFVSAVHLSDLDRVRGYETGAVDYVSVPVVPEILRAKIGVFIELYRKTRELERLNVGLEERVSMRTAELEDSIRRLRASENALRLQGEELTEADRRKNEFLAMLAHELRNPLQPIRASVELWRQPKALLSQQQWAQGVIDRQLNQMVRLVDDLLDASRITSGKLELRRSVIDILDVITGALESIASNAEHKGHRVDVNVPPGPILLNGDAVRLTQVFLNLLNNAVKYTPPGGHIQLEVRADDQSVEISVRDNGIGIDEADMGRLFEMFYQGKPRGDDAQGGLGLGLALVHRLVQLHGGTIKVRSPGIGQGSEFVVRLATMATSLPAAAPVPTGHDTLPAGSARRVLVVDDNRDAAETLAMMLRLEGHDVETAFDGASAIAAAATSKPDIVLMDLGMPKVDGYEAARAIRRDARGRTIFLIALTGWGGEADRQLSRQAGFDRHLVKPVVPAELLALLSSVAVDAAH